MAELNKKQNKILKFGLAAILLCCLFPPWMSTYKSKTSHRVRSEGYNFITTPPKAPSYQHSVNLDVSRLLLQLFVVSVATGGGIIISKKKQE